MHLFNLEPLGLDNLYMLLAYLVGKALQNPFVQKSLVRFEPFFRHPSKTLLDEGQKLFVLAVFEFSGQWLRAWSSEFSLAVGDRFGLEVVKEFLGPGAPLNKFHRRRAEGLEKHLDLFFLIFAWEDGVSGEEFAQDASKRPDIDFVGVPDTENDLRSAIETALNVGVELLMLKSATAHIDDLDSSFIFLF